MQYHTLDLHPLPRLNAPVVLIGLRGWGDALNVSSAMASYVVDALGGETAGSIVADACYRYDESRPTIEIIHGRMHAIHPPGGHLFAAETGNEIADLLVVIADEPSLNWYRLAAELVDLAVRCDATALISLGSMFDHVLHTDRIISAVSSGDEFADIFRRHRVRPIDYSGPGAFHSVIAHCCQQRDLATASLWAHCPIYLQGITHSGMLLTLAHLLGDMTGCLLPIHALEQQWKKLDTQIAQLIRENPKMTEIINKIRREKGDRKSRKPRRGKKMGDNVINLKDFIDT